MSTYHKLNKADRIAHKAEKKLIKARKEKISAENSLNLNPDDVEAVHALQLAESRLASAEKLFANANVAFDHLLCEVELNPPQPPLLTLCCVVQA